MNPRGRRIVAVVIVALLAVGVVAALLSAALSAGPSGTPPGAPGDGASGAGSTAGPTAGQTPPASGSDFELRQVLFQESGQTLHRPAIAPGPEAGGAGATDRLLRIDCDRAPRPSEPDDLIVACDALGFRYGLGPSELPADAVASAEAGQAPDGSWAVFVTLSEPAAATFADVSARLARSRPPLNQLAIVLNGAVVSAPAVNERITGGQVQIAGAFTQQEAEALAASLA